MVDFIFETEPACEVVDEHAPAKRPYPSRVMLAAKSTGLRGTPDLQRRAANSTSFTVAFIDVASSEALAGASTDSGRWSATART
jgi:hypothetical protein